MATQKVHWMIYGANGYSATLALEKAVAQGRKPTLGGRTKVAIELLAKNTAWNRASSICPPPTRAPNI